VTAVASSTLSTGSPATATVIVWLATVAAGVASCYDNQRPAADDIAALTLPTTAVADGKSIVMVKASVDPATPNTIPISITVSTGVVSFAVAATDSGARQISLRNDGTGQLTTPWLMGTRAGEAVVILAAGGATRIQSITLAPSQPAHLTLGLDTTTLKLDGTAHAQATVSLAAADPGSSVSDGTVVRFAFCCPDQTGSTLLTECAEQPPLTIPTQVTALGAIATATVGTQAVAASAADGGLPRSTDVFLVVTTMYPVSCIAPASGTASPWASAKMTLTNATTR
jgi:hypothetical protein